MGADPADTATSYPWSMRGLQELVPAQVRSESAMAEPGPAFAMHGLELEDALRFCDESSALGDPRA
jgi:hypothetical protein